MSAASMLASSQTTRAVSLRGSFCGTKPTVARVASRAPRSKSMTTVAAITGSEGNQQIEITFQPMVEAGQVHPPATSRNSSFARAHFSDRSEAAINDQINIEYNVSYVYHAMYAYFTRDNVYLPGLAKFFKDASAEEREHAEMLMDYQVMRGGRVALQAIVPPQVEYDHAEKGDALYAMELALSLEKLNNDKLLDLHKIADEEGDAQMCDFVEGSLLADQVKSIQEVSEMVAQLRRMGNDGQAVWLFDQMLLKNGA